MKIKFFQTFLAIGCCVSLLTTIDPAHSMAPDDGPTTDWRSNLSGLRSGLQIHKAETPDSSHTGCQDGYVKIRMAGYWSGPTPCSGCNGYISSIKFAEDGLKTAEKNLKEKKQKEENERKLNNQPKIERKDIEDSSIKKGEKSKLDKPLDEKKNQEVDRSTFESRQKAAQQGDIIAQCQLGKMYRRGLGVPKDEKKSFEWFKKAADQGDAKAQSVTGLNYRYGFGVDEDPKRAVEYFNKAEKQNEIQALHQLSDMYLNGEGVRVNEALAEKYRKRAIALHQNPWTYTPMDCDEWK